MNGDGYRECNSTFFNATQVRECEELKGKEEGFNPYIALFNIIAATCFCIPLALVDYTGGYWIPCRRSNSPYSDPEAASVFYIHSQDEKGLRKFLATCEGDDLPKERFKTIGSVIIFLKKLIEKKLPYSSLDLIKEGESLLSRGKNLLPDIEGGYSSMCDDTAVRDFVYTGKNFLQKVDGIIPATQRDHVTVTIGPGKNAFELRGKEGKKGDEENEKEPLLPKDKDAAPKHPSYS